MKCHVIEKQGCTVVRIFGSINGRDPRLIRRVLHSGINERQPKIVLDMGDLDDGGDIAAQLGMLAAFQKEVDFMSGYLKLCSLGPQMKNCFLKYRLDKIFDFYEDLTSAEKSLWERKEYEEKQRYNRAAA